MTDVLRSRRSHAVAPVEPDAAALDVRLKHANAVAAARQALPPGYANNPGAILLAQEWAQTRGVDLMTTIQSVSFVHGRPVVDATMQRALAMRAGYEIAIDVDEEKATCTLTRDGKKVGASTYTLDDARTAGLAEKDNWRKNPKAMLVARATAQTMRWYAPDVMVGVFTEDELEDPVDTLGPTDGGDPESQEVSRSAAGAQEGSTPSTAAGSPPTDDDGDVVDAELVPTDDEVLAQVVEATKGLDRGTAADLRTWVEAQGFPTDKKKLTADQAREVLAWLDRRPGQGTDQ